MSLLLAAVFVCSAVLLLAGLLYTRQRSRTGTCTEVGTGERTGAGRAVSVLVVAGSGGHTSEILRLVESLSDVYKPRHYIIADTDSMSEDKISSSENSRSLSGSQSGPQLGPQYYIYRVPRSREVGQSWSSSIISTLKALRFTLPLVFRLRPDMVLCNGPGTCVPVCAAGLLLRLLGIQRVVIVYVESVCRVQSLSLTGRILYPLAHYFFVQWPSLRDKYPKSIFLGRIV